MFKGVLKRRFIFLLVLVFLSSFFVLKIRGVKALIHISDTLSSSVPGSYSNHSIKFQTVHSIPPGGKIVISPESGFFTFPTGFNYSDVDLSTSATSNGVYSERELSNLPTAFSDGVSEVVATSTNVDLTFTLNSSFGINAGNYVLIELGENATYSEFGDLRIMNPSSVGSYSIPIYTYDESGAYIERSLTMVNINRQVAMGNYIQRQRSNGSPSGWLSYGTAQTIMSLYTNYKAHCRYSTASNTPYALMMNEFSYIGATTTGNYHTVEVGGLANGGEYNYFIRCEDETGGQDTVTGCVYSAASTSPYLTASGTPIVSLDCIDYWIKFSVSNIAGGIADDGTGTGGGDNDDIETDDGDGDSSGPGSSAPGGGGMGGGSGGGIGIEVGRGLGSYLPYPPLPDAPGVVLKGWAYPNTDVVILKDGQEQGKALAGSDAEFGAFLEDLVQGVYTFSMWADDSAGRRSKTYSTTFWIDDGTQTTVSDIFLPPTIALRSNSVNVGTSVNVLGQTVPQADVEVWFYPKKDGNVLDSEIIKTTAKADALGSWSALVGTNNLSNGSYLVKARARLGSSEDASVIGDSDFGHTLDCEIGGAVEVESSCAGADLNGDGKVNITDFSILLYYWGTDNECADQNSNGTVDLIDFSIMMYYWTG